MSLFLLVAAACSLWYGWSVFYNCRGSTAPIRAGLMTASLVVSALVVGLTEALSYTRSLTKEYLVWAWLSTAVVSIGWAMRQYRTGAAWPSFRWMNLSRIERFWIGCTAIVWVLTGLTGLLYPPSNNDSLTYHLGRIGHWMQQNSVQPYATHIERQLYQPPLSEWIMLHVIELSDSDIFVNAVQWVAGLGCAAGLSMLTRLLGGNRTAQIATLFTAATIPMVILQMSSTQNDVVVAYYLIGLTVCLLRYYQDRHTADLIWAGLSLGFAWLTKGTAYLYAGPILLAWGIGELIRRPRSGFTGRLLLVGRTGMLMLSLAVFVNAGHYWRNVQIYGHPLTEPAEQARYTNEVHSPGMLVSNVSRNLTLHTGFPGFHWLAQHGVERLHDWMGVPILDSRTTYSGTVFDMPMLSNNEDNASNFVHLLWLTATIIWVVRVRKTPGSRQYVLLSMVAMGAFLIFCGYLKWQPWHSRLHTFMFLLASPVCAYGLISVDQRYRWGLSGLVSLSALSFAATNFTRPLLAVPPLTLPISFTDGRLKNYYVNRQGLFRQYHAMASHLNRYRQDSLHVGIISDENDPDYMWFREIEPPTKLYHIRVQTASKQRELTPHLDYIIAPPNWMDTLNYRGYVYRRITPKTRLERTVHLSCVLFRTKQTVRGIAPVTLH